MSKELFVLLPLLSSGANLALRRIGNEDTGLYSSILQLAGVLHSLRMRQLRDIFLDFIRRSGCISCRDFQSDGSTSKKTSRSML